MSESRVKAAEVEAGVTCKIQRIGDIDALKGAIMEEAQREARQILDDAEAKATSIIRPVEREVNAQRTEIVARAEEQAESYRRHAISAARLSAQNLKLRKREGLLNHVFEMAREKLTKLPDTEEYGEIVQHLIRQAVARLAVQSAVIHADARAREILDGEGRLDDLARELGVELRLGDVLQKGLGVVVETPDGRCCYDNTFSSRLERMREDLRNPVYEILMSQEASTATEASHDA